MVVGLAALIGGQHLEGGHLSSVMQFTPAIIVLGGTLGAVMVNIRSPNFWKGSIWGSARSNRSRTIPPGTSKKQLVDYANIVRKEETGILSSSSGPFEASAQLISVADELLHTILAIKR